MNGCDAIITVTVTDDCGNSDSVVYNARIDSEPPTIASVNALQGSAQVKDCAANVLEGVVNISVQASDNCGLAGDRPTLTLANGSDTASAQFVNESPSGTFNYVWSVTPTSAAGTWTAIVSASDSCHTTTSTFTLCVNKAQIIGSVQSEGFIGGNRVVTFTAKSGASTKVWNLDRRSLAK